MESCGKSAANLVALVTRHFPGIPLFHFFVLLEILDVSYMIFLSHDFVWRHDEFICQETEYQLPINSNVGFRDHSVYKGHQVFLYKRAQIFAADLWGAFEGQGYGEFNDISSITIFADYIVPAVLRQLGVLRYSSDLASIIEANREIGSGSEEEVELRACSIYAVEKMRELLSKKSGNQVWLNYWLYLFLFSCPLVQRTGFNLSSYFLIFHGV